MHIMKTSIHYVSPIEEYDCHSGEYCLLLAALYGLLQLLAPYTRLLSSGSGAVRLYNRMCTPRIKHRVTKTVVHISTCHNLIRFYSICLKVY